MQKEVLIPSAEYEELKTLLGSETITLKTMEEKGFLPLYFPLFKNVLAHHDSGKIPQLIEQSIAGALSTKCSNTYCFVGHAMFLTNNGITHEELKEIIQQLRFPSRIPESEKWSKILKWAFLFGNSSMGNPAKIQELDTTINNLLDDDEKGQLFNLIIASTVLNRLSEFYADVITCEKDIPPGEQGEQLRMQIPRLVAFYHKVSDSDNEERPVVTMCMHCKDIRDTTGKWLALETSLSALDRNSMFSHSICDRCYEKYHANPSK